MRLPQLNFLIWCYVRYLSHMQQGISKEVIYTASYQVFAPGHQRTSVPSLWRKIFKTIQCQGKPDMINVPTVLNLCCIENQKSMWCTAKVTSIYILGTYSYSPYSTQTIQLQPVWPDIYKLVSLRDTQEDTYRSEGFCVSFVRQNIWTEVSFGHALEKGAQGTIYFLYVHHLGVYYIRSSEMVLMIYKRICYIPFVCLYIICLLNF